MNLKLLVIFSYMVVDRCIHGDNTNKNVVIKEQLQFIIAWHKKYGFSEVHDIKPSLYSVLIPISGE